MLIANAVEILLINKILDYLITLRAQTFRIQTDFSLCQQLFTMMATADAHKEPHHWNEPGVNPKLIRTTSVTAFYQTINVETFGWDVNQKHLPLKLLCKSFGTWFDTRALKQLRRKQGPRSPALLDRSDQSTCFHFLKPEECNLWT